LAISKNSNENEKKEIKKEDEIDFLNSNENEKKEMKKDDEIDFLKLKLICDLILQEY
jgi:hypothetical protein